mgnify:CR=1 FL=1
MLTDRHSLVHDVHVNKSSGTGFGDEWAGERGGELHARCERLLAQVGIDGELRGVRSLEGGVSSDIVVVDVAGRRLCVKFALPTLKTTERWEAPVGRNASEYAWLRFAATFAPDNVPALLGQAEGGFAMAFVEGPDVRLWKRSLLDGQGQPVEEARAVGDLLGRVHAGSARPEFEREPFDNLAWFEALRIEPYLRFTASRHAALAARLTALADELREGERVLIHGDVSPKNILFRSAHPILLDAECATMGDAAFDIAFCMNHLVLKSVHLPDSRRTLLAAVLALWSAYEPHVDWENQRALASRVVALLPALMLARVDGKSPVEYLSDVDRERVRRLATTLLEDPSSRLGDLHDRLQTGMSAP